MVQNAVAMVYYCYYLSLEFCMLQSLTYHMRNILNNCSVYRFGVIIAFVTNKHLDSGFESTTLTMRHGSEDTSMYLTEVSDHVYHLFVNNYEELETHLVQIVKSKYPYSNITH